MVETGFGTARAARAGRGIGGLGGQAGRGGGRGTVAQLRPVRFGAAACYRRDEVFRICEALSLAEDLLAASGRHGRAAVVAGLREAVEARLVRH